MEGTVTSMAHRNDIQLTVNDKERHLTLLL